MKNQFRQDKIEVISKGYYLDLKGPICQEIINTGDFSKYRL